MRTIMTEERFQELRQEITIKGVPLKDAPFETIVAEWDGGMYLDAAEGLTPDQDERLIAVEREMCARPEAAKQE